MQTLDPDREARIRAGIEARTASLRRASHVFALVLAVAQIALALFCAYAWGYFSTEHLKTLGRLVALAAALAVLETRALRALVVRARTPLWRAELERELG